jgi:hypothetical protein
MDNKFVELREKLDWVRQQGKREAWRLSQRVQGLRQKWIESEKKTGNFNPQALLEVDLLVCIHA